MTLMKIKVRGIYSTALTQLLLELGYQITQPSEKQRERFKIDSEEEPDVSIRDLKDLSGISILGNTEDLIDDLISELWDSVFIKVMEEKIKEGKYFKIVKSGLTFHDSIPESKKEEILKVLAPYIPQGYGFIVKKEASLASEEELKKDLESTLNSEEKPFYKWYVFFGKNSKQILDEYRRKVIPTMINHHTYRSGGLNVIDFSEKLIEKGVSPNLIEETIKEYFVQKLKDEGTVYVTHKKIQGRDFTKVEVVSDVKISDGEIILKTIRPLKPGINYDGLNIPIEPGDYAMTTYIEGNWYFIREYYNSSGELKGKYINVNTPIEIVENKIRYIDLIVDVIELNGEKKVIDLEELRETLNNIRTNRKLLNKIEETVRALSGEETSIQT